jgi:hypothetical protein
MLIDEAKATIEADETFVGLFEPAFGGRLPMVERSESEKEGSDLPFIQKAKDEYLLARLKEAEREKKARVEAEKKERKAQKAAQQLEKRKAAQKVKLAKKKAEWLAGGRQRWMEKQKEKRAKAAAKRKEGLAGGEVG